MHADGSFDERVAATYDDPGSLEFDPDLLARTSEVLAAQARGGAALDVTTQHGQVEVFRNAAAHLEPGGRLLIETMVPELHRLLAGGNVVPFHVSDDRLGFDEYDVMNQGMVSHHLYLDGGRVDRFSVPFRYVWPSELDLMAQLAGMRLVERWSGWDQAPFTSDSSAHVSVWEKPG